MKSNTKKSGIPNDSESNTEENESNINNNTPIKNPIKSPSQNSSMPNDVESKKAPINKSNESNKSRVIPNELKTG